MKTRPPAPFVILPGTCSTVRNSLNCPAGLQLVAALPSILPSTRPSMVFTRLVTHAGAVLRSKAGPTNLNWSRNLRKALLCRFCSSGSQVESTDNSAGFLTGHQVTFFKQHGYLAVENFWSDSELRAIRVALHKLQLRGALANVATTGDGKTHTSEARNLQLCPLSPEAPLFRSLPFSAKASRAVAELLLDSDKVDNEGVSCYLSQTFWKPPHHGMGTSWHQDNAYFGVKEARRGTAMWTAAHDATRENGTIEVIPDIWQGGLLGHERDGESDHHITCRKHVDESKAVTVELKAGGVLFFNYNTPHCTRANTTGSARAAVAYHFLATAHWVKRAFPLPENAEWITPIVWGPGCTKGVAEYGERVDTFETDVQAGLLEEAEILHRGSGVQGTARTVQQDMNTSQFSG